MMMRAMMGRGGGGGERADGGVNEVMIYDLLFPFLGFSYSVWLCLELFWSGRVLFGSGYAEEFVSMKDSLVSLTRWMMTFNEPS